MITVTAGCSLCGARFTRQVLTAQDAALVALGGQCDACYDQQEMVRVYMEDAPWPNGYRDEGGEA